MKQSVLRSLLLSSLLCATALLVSCAEQNKTDKPKNEAAKANVHWDKITGISKTTPTLQVVVNPPLLCGSKIHDNAFQSLHDLQADDVRYVPWVPYPRLGVAELERPSNGKTSWDFSLIDPITVDFLEATKGHPVMLNFSTIPTWMFKTEKPVSYPADPDQPVWDYGQGTELHDPSMKEVGDYYGRLFSWYPRADLPTRWGSGMSPDITIPFRTERC